MSSRSVSDMHPDLREKYAQFAIEMQKANIDYVLTCTYRSGLEQNELYEQGRFKPGRIVTKAKAGQSPHNHFDGKPSALAFDIVILNNGKAIWEKDNPDWQAAGAIGERVGLEWAGNWKYFAEYPHFQLKNWKDYK